jgi:hypothetical protein
MKHILVVILPLLLVARSSSFHPQKRFFHRSYYAIIKGVRGGSSAEDISNAVISSDCKDETETNGTLTYSYETDNGETPIGELEDVHEHELQQDDEEDTFSEENSIGHGFNTLDDNDNFTLDDNDTFDKNLDEDEDELFEENDSDSIGIGIDNVEIKDIIEETESDDISIMMSLTREQELEESIILQEEAFPDVPTCTEDLNTDTEMFIGNMNESHRNDGINRSVSVDNKNDTKYEDPPHALYPNSIGLDTYIDNRYDADSESCGSILSDPVLSPTEPSMDFALETDEKDANALYYKPQGEMEVSPNERYQFLSDEDKEQDIQDDLNKGQHVDVGVQSQYVDDAAIGYSRDEDNECSNDEESYDLHPEHQNHSDKQFDQEVFEDLNEGDEHAIQDDLNKGRDLDVGVQSQYVDDAAIGYSRDEDNEYEANEYEAHECSNDEESYELHPEHQNHSDKQFDQEVFEDLNEGDEHAIQDDLNKGQHVDVGVHSQYVDDAAIGYSRDEDNEYEAHECSNDEESYELHPEHQNYYDKQFDQEVFEDLNEGDEHAIQDDLNKGRDLDVDVQSQYVDDAAIGYSRDEELEHEEPDLDHQNHSENFIAKSYEDLDVDKPYFHEFADDVEMVNNASIGEKDSMQPLVTDKGSEEALDVEISSHVESPCQLENTCTGEIEMAPLSFDNKHMSPKTLKMEEKVDYPKIKLQDSLIPDQISDGASSGVESTTDITSLSLSNNLDTSLDEVNLDNCRTERMQETNINLGIEIETDTDLEFGSDSTAFVDRMDLADAYDDDDKCSERTDVADAPVPKLPMVTALVASTFVDKVQFLRSLAFRKENRPLLGVLSPILEIKELFLRKMQQLRPNASTNKSSQSFLNKMQWWGISTPETNEARGDAKALKALGYSSQEIKSMKPDIRIVFAKKGFQNPKNGLPDEFFDGTREKERKVFGIDAKVLRRVSVSTFAACIALALQSSKTNTTRNYTAQETLAILDDLTIIDFEARQERLQSGLESFTDFNILPLSLDRAP